MGRWIARWAMGLVMAWAGVAQAQSGRVEVPLNGEVSATTGVLATPVATAFGSPSDPKTVFHLGPLAPGRRYEVTLTYDAGGDVGYGHSWVDGSPFGREWHSFVGIGSGTGSRPLAGKQEKFLFTVDGASTSRYLYLVLRTSKPFPFKVALTDRLSGLTPESKDRWGYTFVTDFDKDRTAPFLLKREGGGAPPPVPAASGPWIDVPVNGEAPATTGALSTPVASAFGAPTDPKSVFRLGPLTPGRRYEVTLTYDAGGDVGYGHSWVDGSPFGREWHSFVGIGSGTGSRPMAGKQERFLFTVDGASTSRYLFLVLRTGKPLPVKVALTDRLSGVTPESKDRWGYFFVTDFDKDRTAPFLLKR